MSYWNNVVKTLNGRDNNDYAGTFRNSGEVVNGEENENMVWTENDEVDETMDYKLRTTSMIPEIFRADLNDLIILYTFCDNIIQGITDYCGVERFEKYGERVNNLIDYITNVGCCLCVDKPAAVNWYRSHIEQGIMLYSNNTCWFEYDVLKKYGEELCSKSLYDIVITDYDAIVSYLYDIMYDVIIYQLEQSCRQIKLNANLIRTYVHIFNTAVVTAYADCYNNFIQNCNTVTQLLCTEYDTYKQVMCWLGLGDLMDGSSKLIDDYLNLDDDKDSEDEYFYDMPSDYDAGGTSGEYETDDLLSKDELDSANVLYDMESQCEDSEDSDWD